MAGLSWHPEAADELDEIAARIARDSPSAARALAQRIVAATERLRDFPRSGRIVPEADDETIRELIVGSYRVVYRLLDDGVQITMVRHGARLLGDIREPLVP